MAYRQRRKPNPLSVTLSPNDDVSAANPDSFFSKNAEQESTVPSELPAALDRIADLEAQCCALRQRATALELQQETTQRRMAAMELAIRRLRTAANNPATLRDTPPATGEPAESAKAFDGASAPEALPWMTPSTEDFSGQVPRWTLMADDFMTALDTRVDRLLDNFPEVLMVLGLGSAAMQIRQWQRSPTRTFRRVAHAIARRIVCTDKAARQGEQNLRDFVSLTIKSLLVPHPNEDTGDRGAWAQLIAEGEKTLPLIAAFLQQKLQDADWMTGAARGVALNLRS